MTNKTQWLYTTEEKIESLISDEAKVLPMLENMNNTIKQLKAKQSFRLALLNQIHEELQEKK